MYRVLVFFLIIVISYATFIDIKKGTLPLIQKVSTNATTNPLGTYMQTIKPGETVLTIVEKKEKKLPTSIENIINDFELLNNGLSPDQVTIGQRYRFRDY